MNNQSGGWVYIMANRYRGSMYVGVTSDLAARVARHQNDDGSDFCKRYNLRRLVYAEFTSPIDQAIAHEKRVKRWRRSWKIDLIERKNPEWKDLYCKIHA